MTRKLFEKKQEETRQRRAEEISLSRRLKQISDEELVKLKTIIKKLKEVKHG